MPLPTPTSIGWGVFDGRSVKPYHDVAPPNTPVRGVPPPDLSSPFSGGRIGQSALRGDAEDFRAPGFAVEDDMKSKHNTPSDRSSGFAPDQVFERGHEIGKIEGKTDRMIEELAELKEEIRKLHMQVGHTKNQKRYFEQECTRLRIERDKARTQRDQLQQLSDSSPLGSPVSSFRADKPSSSPGSCSPQTPSKSVHGPIPLRPIPSGHLSTEVAENDVNKDKASTKTISHKPANSCTSTNDGTEIGAPGPSIINLATVAASNAPLHERMSRLFFNVSQWAVKFPTLEIREDRADFRISHLKDEAMRICRDRSGMDLLNSTKNRRFLVSAMVNERLLEVFGLDVLNGYGLDPQGALGNVYRMLAEAGPADVLVRKALLEQRADIFNRTVYTPHCQAWIEHRASELTGFVTRLFEPIIPEDSQARATAELRNIVRECYTVSLTMITLPREWIVDAAVRGQRWEPHTMAQCEGELNGNPSLTEGNGFRWIVRLGIAPSVTERNFSTGSLTTQEQHKKVVLLMPNNNPRTYHTPRATRR